MFKTFIVLILFLVSQKNGADPPQKILQVNQLIIISLSTKTLEFYDQNKLIFKCSVRIGKKGTPTPLGTGYIYEKRDRPVFRYVDPGPQKGEIINYAECGDGLKKVNHSKMRALGIKTKNTTKYSIHSTTCSETIGQAISNGCIGTTVQDMLKLYPLVKEGAVVEITK